MRIVRYAHHGQANYGLLVGDTVYELLGDVYGEFEGGAPVARYDELSLLPPCQPTKIVGVARNYRQDSEQVQAEIPPAPILFLKPPSAVIGPADPIILPDMSTEVIFEAELAVVIKRRAKHVKPFEAPACVLGFTCGNDVTAQDLAKTDLTITRGKGFDTFCPLGPKIATGLDASNLTISTRVNGEVRQESTTKHMVFSVPQLVSYISQVMTLEPGDVILTGTPAGAGPLKDSDVVEIEIEGIGTMANRVVSETDHH